MPILVKKKGFKPMNSAFTLRNQNKLKQTRNKEIIQIQWEINKKENRKAIEKHQTHQKLALWKDQ